MHAAADLGLVRFMKLVIPRPERTRDCGMTMKILAATPTIASAGIPGWEMAIAPEP